MQVNPWWRTTAEPTAWATDDPTLRGRRSYDLGYRSSVLSDISTGPVDDKLVVLRGPRRVGKSVLLKDTIVELCARRDLDVRQVIYLPADGMRSRDLHRVAILGRELTRSVGTRPRVWLLDEVTSIVGWTSTMKFLRDNTELATDTVVCTGSSWSADSAVERDLLAGRAGGSSTRRTRLLLPMRFRDVLVATERKAPMPGPLSPWDLQGASAQEAVGECEFFIDELDLAWQAYLSSGGFPRAVAEYHRSSQVGDAFLTDLVSWLHRDVDPDAADDSVPRLLAELATRSTSPLNRTACAQALGYSTRQAFDTRLTRLVTTFAGLWSHQVDDAGRRIAGAQSKLYLSDPLLAWVGPRLRSGLGDPDFTRLSENALGVALAEAVEDHQPGRWVTQDVIGHVRSASGNEIDFASLPIPTPAGEARTTPLESKWVSRHWRAESRGIDQRLGRGIVATKDILDVGSRVWAVPVPIVALLLG